LRAIETLQKDFDKKIITQVLPFHTFKLNTEEYQNYLYSRRDNAFCKTYIHTKLALLRTKFSKQTNQEKLKELKD